MISWFLLKFCLRAFFSSLCERAFFRLLFQNSINFQKMARLDGTPEFFWARTYNNKVSQSTILTRTEHCTHSSQSFRVSISPRKRYNFFKKASSYFWCVPKIFEISNLGYSTNKFFFWRLYFVSFPEILKQTFKACNGGRQAETAVRVRHIFFQKCII